MKSLLLFLLLLSHSVFAIDLKIEENATLKAVIAEMTNPGSTPEIYPFSEKYRIDLTLKDLIDQTALIAEDQQGLNDRLKAALLSDGKNINFLSWLKTLKSAAEANTKLLESLNKKLYLQFYSSGGVALLPEYKFIDFKKIKDNGKLSRIKKYNKIAGDPEAQGLLMAYAKKPDARFYTDDLTVAKLKKIKFSSLRELKTKYYDALAALYQYEDSRIAYSYYLGKLRIEGESTHKAKKLFKTIQELPNKHQILLYLASEVPSMPYRNSMHLITMSYIEKNLNAILESLKDYTLAQIIHSDDDEYLLLLRKWMDKNIQSIEVDLDIYNQNNNSSLTILYKNRTKKPRRLEAIFSQEILLKVYPDAPWMKGSHGVLFNKNGKQIYFDKTVSETLSRFFVKLGRELIQTETYISLLAGTATLILSEGNLPVAIGTQKLVNNAIETSRYDREWKEFLHEAPMEVVNTFLLTSGFAAGRFYKILALGAGQGALQSYFTGQDIKTGAAVGAGLNLIQYYLLPLKIAKPMSHGLDEAALKLNRQLETLEKSVRGTIQAATVATIEGDPLLSSSIKGLVYGFVSAKVMIWFLGTRYYAFKNYNSESVDEMIQMENEFQNGVGRGGAYEINRQLILDANYRVGGALPKLITASITLPGNVAMSDGGYYKLTTLTHEAHHLMQQHQSGVFGFYLFRYIPTSFLTGYNGHPDENFLANVIR